jgi:hypothetical protein
MRKIFLALAILPVIASAETKVIPKAAVHPRKAAPGKEPVPPAAPAASPAQTAAAQEPSSAAEAANEPEKPLPQIFQAFDANAPTADSVIFVRTDFNDLMAGKSQTPFRFQVKPGD